MHSCAFKIKRLSGTALYRAVLDCNLSSYWEKNYLSGPLQGDHHSWINPLLLNFIIECYFSISSECTFQAREGPDFISQVEFVGEQGSNTRGLTQEFFRLVGLHAYTKYMEPTGCLIHNSIALQVYYCKCHICIHMGCLPPNN